MIYRVRHVTTYDYASAVELGSHLAHLLPRSVPGTQRVLASRLSTSPAASFRRDELDHFGNRAVFLTVEQAHTRFEIETISRVDVIAPIPDDASQGESTPDAQAIAAAARNEWQVGEFLLPSPLLPASEEAAAYARESFPPGRAAIDGVRDLTHRIHCDFAFRTGITSPRSSVGDVLRLRAGVCQDFSHLMIAGLRGLGVPARYVSGYIRTTPPPGGEKRPGSDVSHAWVGVWLGHDQGWLGFDPTNDLRVWREHVILGWGRDYSDVSPLLGVILGGGRHTLHVSVELAEEAAPARTGTLNA